MALVLACCRIHLAQTSSHGLHFTLEGFNLSVHGTETRIKPNADQYSPCSTLLIDINSPVIPSFTYFGSSGEMGVGCIDALHVVPDTARANNFTTTFQLAALTFIATS